MSNTKAIINRFFYLNGLVETCIRGWHTFPAEMASELKLLLQVIDIPDGSKSDREKYLKAIDVISNPSWCESVPGDV